MQTPPLDSYTIVGVVGHIDHGKTTLVKALTGADTDTHPEEKQRGITIDLGFASCVIDGHEFAMIDAPGHQKYIGNLLAGVSAVDVGMLVVACDQGIQEQTLEHVTILQTLGVGRLIVVVTRIDMSDEARLLELTEELQVFLSDYGFRDFPVIPVSSVTGEGLRSLRECLCQSARLTPRSAAGRFRLPIDRVFSVVGRGCVVAGTVWTGEVRVGDTLEVAGDGRKVRVRELEVHSRSVTQSSTGKRTAINITGVSAHELQRGDELLAVQSHRPAARMLIEVSMFRDSPELRCPAVVQMHTATTSCAARITGVRRLLASGRAVVVVETKRPIVATFGQLCLFRRPYPIGSFAGGRVLASLDPRFRQARKFLTLGERLAGSDPLERLAAWVDYLGELQDVDPAWIESQLGLSPERYLSVVDEAVAKKLCLRLAADHLASIALIERIRKHILAALAKKAEECHDAWSVEEAVVQRAGALGSPFVVRRVLHQMLDEQVLVRANNLIAVATDETKLSKRQKARMDQILSLYDGARTPPTVKAAAVELGIPDDSAASLIRFAAQQQLLIELGGGLVIADRVFRQLCDELQQQFEQYPALTVSQIREAWQVSRKYAVPLLEHCDRTGVTLRSGDSRTAGPRLREHAESMPEPSRESN